MLENLCVAKTLAPPCAAATLEAGERALVVVDAELLPHAAATRASGTTNRAGDLTRASLGLTPGR
jgi:hypothetical protein